MLHASLPPRVPLFASPVHSPPAAPSWSRTGAVYHTLPCSHGFHGTVLSSSGDGCVEGGRAVVVDGMDMWGLFNMHGCCRTWGLHSGTCCPRHFRCGDRKRVGSKGHKPEMPWGKLTLTGNRIQARCDMRPSALAQERLFGTCMR